MKQVDWYFDFISPFAYLQSEMLGRVGEKADIHLRPLLFAALLKHWGNVGPAEIEPKRLWTFEHCAWIARTHGIELKLPASHPFNPLPLLRLALALAPDQGRSGTVPIGVVQRLFRFVWKDGHLPEGAALEALLRETGVALEELRAPEIKVALTKNGERAISAGIFGVPSALVDGHSFWGVDATDMLLAWLDGDAFFTSPGYHAARTLAPGLQRERLPRGESGAGPS